MTNDAKELKNLDMRLRRRARTQGFNLIKSRSTLDINHCGGYMIVDSSNVTVSGQHFDMFEDDVEKFLNEGVVVY